MEPLGYLEFLALERQASVVITDSGGVQEETTFLGVPCLTMRANTERPITVSQGTNVLLGQDASRLVVEVERILSGGWKKGSVPALWDGQAGSRIAEIVTRP
jgi:UDP-N-acetylglucosamine 2-epimerase (non-hydrolysing)